MIFHMICHFYLSICCHILIQPIYGYSYAHDLTFSIIHFTVLQFSTPVLHVSPLLSTYLHINGTCYSCVMQAWLWSDVHVLR